MLIGLFPQKKLPLKHFIHHPIYNLKQLINRCLLFYTNGRNNWLEQFNEWLHDGRDLLKKAFADTTHQLVECLYCLELEEVALVFVLNDEVEGLDVV